MMSFIKNVSSLTMNTVVFYKSAYVLVYYYFILVCLLYAMAVLTQPSFKEYLAAELRGNCSQFVIASDRRERGNLCRPR